MNFEEIKQLEQAHIMPTYGRFPVALASGKGAVATDFAGKSYIDFGAGIGVNALGYCDAGWCEAVKRQADTIQHTSNLYYSQPSALLAEKLCKITGMDKIFFGNSGAEANECAIKLARKYSFDKYGDGRGNVVSLVNSFHGRTLATLSATGQAVFHNYFLPFPGGFSYAAAGDLAELETVCGGDTCAVIMEMVQGEGGVMPLEKDYVAAAAAYCKSHDILLIIDEVQTGIARTGTFFSYMQYGIEPDIVTAAKGLGGGLPIGACLCSARLGSVMGPSSHGSTFGGNPVVCAGANYVVDTVSTDDFLREIAQKGDYIRSVLLPLKNVQQVRGLGLMIGIELAAGDAKAIAARCLENGLLVLTAKTAVRLLPPLNINRTELDQGLDILCKVIESF